MSLLRSAGRVAVASSVHGRVQRRQSARWSEQSRAAAAAPPPPSSGGPIAVAHPAEPAPAPTDPPNAAIPGTTMAGRLEQLKLLGELRDAGVLSPAEFEAQKAQVLSG